MIYPCENELLISHTFLQEPNSNNNVNHTKKNGSICNDKYTKRTYMVHMVPMQRENHIAFTNYKPLCSFNINVETIAYLIKILLVFIKGCSGKKIYQPHLN